jgi:hypothetical protein
MKHKGKQVEKILKKAIKVFGVDFQRWIWMEEMSELTKAIIKVKRYPNDKKRMDDLHEEIADAVIVLHQMILCYDKKKIMKYHKMKIDRLKADTKKELKKKM